MDWIVPRKSEPRKPIFGEWGVPFSCPGMFGLIIAFLPDESLFSGGYKTLSWIQSVRLGEHLANCGRMVRQGKRRRQQEEGER